MSKLAYSYIRFSTPEQLKGDSLRRQVEKSQAWCQRNGHTLDDSLRLRDLGVSAFKGNNARQGRLKAFLDAVESGRVAPGAVLLVESLDRLSRDEVGAALRLFLSILEAGITVVTLDPEETFTKDGLNDMVRLIVAIVIMSRAYEESATKSSRLSSAWRNKRERLAERKLTAKCPGWLKLNADRTAFEVIPSRAATVKRIFALAIDGQGLQAITRTLNQDGTPVIGTRGVWHRSYVAKILKNRSVMGEYQPHTGRPGRDRQPIGSPIADYYPRVISDSEFYRAQAALTSRLVQRGPAGQGITNLFTGLVHDLLSGSTMTLVQKGRKSSGPHLVASAAARGEPGAKYTSFPYAAFEDGVLLFLSGLKAADLTPGDDGADRLAADLAEKEARLAALDTKLAEVRKHIKASANIATFLTLWEELCAERDACAAEAERLRAERAAARGGDLERAREIRALLKAAPPKELPELRRRMKSRIAELVSEITAIFQPGPGGTRTAFLRITFRQGPHKFVTLKAKGGRLVEFGGGVPDAPEIPFEELREPLRQLYGLDDPGAKKTPAARRGLG